MLTPAGEVLLTYARRVLGIADEAIMRFNRQSQKSTVRLGMTDEYAIAFLPSVLASFAAAHPLVEIQVTCRSSTVLSDMIDDGELDVALVTANSTGRAGPPAGGIFRDRLVWAAAPQGTAHLRRPLPIAVGPPSCMWRKAAVDALDAAGISYRLACTSENYAGQLAPVLAELAVAPLPCSALPSGVTSLGPEDGLPAVGYFEIALRRSHQASDELTCAVIDHVGAYFQTRLPV